MTLNAHRRKDQRRCRTARVFLNGEDVTARCFYADGRRGVVRLYRLNADGKKYVENGIDRHWRVPKTLQPRVATEERRGHVQWALKS